MTAVDKDCPLARPRNLAENDKVILTFNFLLREQCAQPRIVFIK